MDKTWVTVRGSNAELFYMDNGRQTARIWVDEYEQNHAMAGSTHQSRYLRRYYARTYVPEPLQITGRVHHDEQINEFADFVRGHHKAMLNSIGGFNNSLGLMNLHLEGEGIQVAGWIATIETRLERFEVAPQIKFAFTPINDRYSNNAAITPASAMRSWFSGGVITSPYFDSTAPGP